MINIKAIEKQLGNQKVLQNINLHIQEGTIFGLLGINGAGKSTLLKIIAGIMIPDKGTITYNEIKLNKSVSAMQDIFYLPDDYFFFPDATVNSISIFFKRMYFAFDSQRFLELADDFGFDTYSKVRTFSKGMKKQIAILIAICTNAQYVLCDEIFDGLDAIIRTTIQLLLKQEVEKRALTIIIASHDLKELENVADYIGIIHKGGLLLSREMQDGQLGIHKFQCVFAKERVVDLEKVIEIMNIKHEGLVHTFLAYGEKTEIEAMIKAQLPLAYEEIPLTIEEMFKYEGDRVNYENPQPIL